MFHGFVLNYYFQTAIFSFLSHYVSATARKFPDEIEIEN